MSGKKNPTEKEIQNQILEYLNLNFGCKAWTNQSMGVYDPVLKRYRKPMGKFTSKGVSDIIGIFRGKMLCIEVKSKTGKIQPHQEEFLEEMTRLGAIAFVARSLDDVILNLKPLLTPRSLIGYNPPPQETL